MINEFATEVQKEEWYKLSNGCIDTDGVSDAKVCLTYREVLCEIEVLVSIRTSALQIRGITPFTSSSNRAKRTKSVPRAIKIVCEIFSESIKAIEANIEEQRAQEERRQRKEEQRKNITQRFKLPIVRDVNLQLETLTFRMSKNFCLNFHYEGAPGNETFYIQSIRGKFSSDQIEKFMDCLSECPEAAADRLIHGK